MMDFKWSAAEKKIARRAYDRALDRECAAVLVELRRRVAAADPRNDLWSIHDYLTERREDVDRKYDYRYSQLVMVFGTLLRQGWLDERDIVGLAEDKLQAIRMVASL